MCAPRAVEIFDPLRSNGAERNATEHNANSRRPAHGVSVKTITHAAASTICDNPICNDFIHNNAIHDNTIRNNTVHHNNNKHTSGVLLIGYASNRGRWGRIYSARFSCLRHRTLAQQRTRLLFQKGRSFPRCNQWFPDGAPQTGRPKICLPKFRIRFIHRAVTNPGVRCVSAFPCR